MLDTDAVVSVSWWAVIPLIVVGSVLHFAYDWSGHHRVVAVFAAVNESYWEHIKIAAADRFEREGGYMHMVARVHARRS